jgi:hypothetical protein
VVRLDDRSKGDCKMVRCDSENSGTRWQYETKRI